MARRSHLVSLALAAAAAVPAPAPVAAAIGPYTLPFFTWTGVLQTQDYGPTTCLCEGPGHGSEHWHSGIDYGMAIGTDIAASNAGTVVDQEEGYADGTGGQFGQGNFVQVRHSSTRYSLYYHLTKNGVRVANGSQVSAGQWIADSGNTGHTTGPHLHYELDSAQSCNDNTCDVDPRAWTTSPGRVPWLAQLSSQRTSGTFHIGEGATATWWVKFKNVGGRTWSNTNDTTGKGRMVLYATDGAANPTSISDSPFIAGDWLADNLPTAMYEASVPPDSIGTFTFGLHAPWQWGSYPSNYFNLRSFSIRYLKWTDISAYNVAIYVDCRVAPCPI